MHASGALELAGRLELRSHGLQNGYWVLAASLPELVKHRFVVNQVDALPESAAVSAAFGAREAMLEVAPDGHMHAFYFGKDAPPIFRHVMKTLLTELEVVISPAAGAGGGWTVDEPTMFGLAHVRYDPATGEGSLSRVRKGYARLTGLPPLVTTVQSQGSADLAPEGHVRALQQHDDVHARGDGGGGLDARLDLRLDLEKVTSEAPPVLPVLADLDRTVPGSVDTSPGSTRALLDQQAAGLTMSELAAALTLARDGDVPGKSRFLWRANGLLTRDPDACDELARMFRQKGMSDKQRALILDLLAGTGTPQAQAAMRDALASADAKSSKAYPTLVQRFSFVQHPDRESTDFIEAAYRDATARGDASARYATAYSLGATANHLSKDGDATGADGIADELKHDLERARDPNERAQLLAALGAASRPQDVATIGALARDPDADVRRAAAGALHDDDTPAGLAILLGLVADRAPAVQQAALQSLHVRALAVATLEALAVIVERNTLHRLSYGDLLTLLGTRTAAGAPVVRMLAFVIAHTEDDPSMSTRAKRLLVETGVAGP